MSRINSRQQLKEYCLRALGAPVIMINVDDEQLEDRIDDALDLFWEYHADGSHLVFLNHQVTADDITGQYVTLPDGVLSIVRVLHGGYSGGVGGGNGIAGINLQYQAFMTDLMNPRRIMQGGLSSYYVTQSYLGMMSDTFSTPSRLTFNKYHDRLTLQNDWSRVLPGSWISVEAYVANDPEKINSMWNDRWLKKYTTAMFKMQWGSNLIKFAGAQLPGGMTVNAEQIHNDAKEEVAALELELQNNYQLPVDFFIG